MGNIIRILIVDDHQLVRAGLRALLEAKSAYQIVGEAKSGAEAVALYPSLRPDVVLMDLVMAQMGGISAIEKIRQQDPDARILVVTSFTEDERVIDALKAGARGYLLKDSAPSDLLRAIDAVHAGSTAFNPAATQALLRQIEAPEEPDADSNPLTDREMEVLPLVARGLSNQQIGGRLGIARRTVGTHISNMLEKLDLENRTQLALYALRRGLAPLDSDDEG